MSDVIDIRCYDEKEAQLDREDGMDLDFSYMGKLDCDQKWQHIATEVETCWGYILHLMVQLLESS